MYFYQCMRTVRFHRRLKVPFHANAQRSFSNRSYNPNWCLIFDNFYHVTYFNAENERRALAWKAPLGRNQTTHWNLTNENKGILALILIGQILIFQSLMCSPTWILDIRGYPRNCRIWTLKTIDTDHSRITWCVQFASVSLFLSLKLALSVVSLLLARPTTVKRETWGSIHSPFLF